MEVKAKVYLLGYSIPYNNSEHSLNAERIVAAAGKLCYSKSNIMDLYDNMSDLNCANFLKQLVSYNHESPLEHISFTFGIEGISRACSHQIVRHRIASYSQQSQRYVSFEDDINYIIPNEIKSNKMAKKVFEEAIKNDIKAYKEIVRSLAKEYTKGIYDNKELERLTKKALEDARFALPNACETKIIMTMNARSLLNFLKQRCCERAQWEIREVANQMLDILLDIAPNIFSKAGASCTFGQCQEGKMSCGKKKLPKEKQMR